MGFVENVNIVATDIVDVTTVADNIADVNTVSDNIADVSSVATNIADVIAVHANEADIDTVAGNIDDVNTVAGVSASVTTVATNVDDVNTVAANEEDINAVAGQASNIQAIGPNIDDVTTVADDIANVNTVATNIAEVVELGTNMGTIVDINTNISGSILNAYNWSSEDEDVAVDDGVNTGYSAYHWSKKSEDALSSAIPKVTTPTTGNFPQVDANGDLVNSIYDETSFMATDSISGSFGNLSSPILDLPLIQSIDMKEGSGNTTFTRASEGTYIDRYGVLKYASVNEPRFNENGLLIEGASENLLMYTTNLYKWSRSGTAILSSTITAPDGTDTAYEIADAGNGILQDEAVIVSGNTYTSSIYVKANTATDFRIVLTAPTWNASNMTNTYDLSNGTFTISAAALDGGMEDVGNGWYRCWVTKDVVASSTTNTVRFIVDGDTGTESLYVWGAQVEELPFASSYIPSVETFTSRASTATYFDSTGTMQTAAIDEERISYNPSDLTAPSYQLFEGESTNLYNYSEDYTSATAAYETHNADSTLDGDTGYDAPDGSTNACLFSCATTADVGRRLRKTSANRTALTDGVTYTGSVYVKAKDWQYIGVSISNGTAVATNIASITFDLTNVEVTRVQIGISGSIVDVGNGWRRVSVTGVESGSNTLYSLKVVLLDSGTEGIAGDAVGVVGNGVYLFGHQIEESTYATSYIPTTTTAVTRSADVYTSASGTRSADVSYIQASNNISTPTACSIYAKAIMPNFTTNFLYNIGSTNLNDRATLTSSTTIRVNVNGESTTVTHGVSVGEEFSLCVVYDNGSSSIYINGILSKTDTYTVSDFFYNENIYIGHRPDNTTSQWNESVKDFRIYDKAFTAQEIALLGGN